MKPKTLILRTAGTNCDYETAHAFELAGASSERVHVNRLIETPSLIDQYQILAVPGGFSYGDDIAAGRIFANQILHHLRDAFQRFVAAGKPIIGICNGFQVLVKTDMLPGPLAGRSGQTCTLTHNDSHRFVDQWVGLSARGKKCIWTRGVGDMDLPIAHGEGKFVPADDAVRQALWQADHVALVYAPSRHLSSDHTQKGHNPNGSVDDIAGICDATGLVFGLMPHPERYVDATQSPLWTRHPSRDAQGDGLQLMRNAVAIAR